MFAIFFDFLNFWDNSRIFELFDFFVVLEFLNCALILRVIRTLRNTIAY